MTIDKKNVPTYCFCADKRELRALKLALVFYNMTFKHSDIEEYRLEAEMCDELKERILRAEFNLVDDDETDVIIPLEAAHA